MQRLVAPHSRRAGATGTVDPARVITNGGARPGDKLVLTKPIGTGVLTSAVKAGHMPADDLTEAVEVMIGLNRAASEAMQAVGVSAATDVTGFGLVGHAFEMASASGVTVRIRAEAVPLLGRTIEFAERGIVTRSSSATRSYLGDRLEVGGVHETLVSVLCDAQTSGGLLIAVAADRCVALTERLASGGTSCAAEIGDVPSQSAVAVALD